MPLTDMRNIYGKGKGYKPLSPKGKNKQKPKTNEKPKMFKYEKYRNGEKVDNCLF